MAPTDDEERSAALIMLQILCLIVWSWVIVLGVGTGLYLLVRTILHHV